MFCGSGRASGDHPIYEEILALPDFEKLDYDNAADEWVLVNGSGNLVIKETDLSQALCNKLRTDSNLLSANRNGIIGIRKSGDDVFFTTSYGFSGYEMGAVFTKDQYVDVSCGRITQLIRLDVPNMKYEGYFFSNYPLHVYLFGKLILW